jgi:cytochrome b561
MPTEPNIDPPSTPTKYPLSMRMAHWLRALVLMGTLGVGALMVRLPDELPMKFEQLYPNHKQFGLLALLLALVQLGLRSRSRIPELPIGLQPWERVLAKGVKASLYALLVVVPLMGYSMSSTFTQSDGVPFFFLGHVPELLPKNDQWFEVFQLIHRCLAYALLVLLVVHIAGAIKHRYLDRDRRNDVLQRML